MSIIHRQDLFSVPIWTFDVPTDVIDYDKVEKEIKDIQVADPKGNVISNYGGWQSGDLNRKDNEEIDLILEYIEYKAKNIFQQYEIIDSYKKSIDSAWANINTQHNYNHAHIHAETVLAGCVYIKTPDNCGDMLIHRPSTAEYYFTSTHLKPNTHYNYEHIRCKALKGQAFIFPAYLLHSVEPSQSIEERISIAFNFKGK